MSNIINCINFIIIICCCCCCCCWRNCWWWWRWDNWFNSDEDGLWFDVASTIVYIIVKLLDEYQRNQTNKQTKKERKKEDKKILTWMFFQFKTIFLALQSMLQLWRFKPLWLLLLLLVDFMINYIQHHFLQSWFIFRKERKKEWFTLDLEQLQCLM